MLVQSRLSGAGAQWRQMSRLGKTAVMSLAFIFLLGILWGTGTVDVDYVRNQFASIGENRGDEPIPTQKVETPIIDGVPNDQNDRIPDEIIEGATTKSSATTTNTETKSEKEKEEKEKAIPTVVATPEVEVKPAKAESAEPVKSANTEPATEKVKPIADGIPLRIMFIGASMTLGDPPQSAYRMQLREWLVALGNPVNCVGTNRFGHFNDNDVQAFPSTPIKLLHEGALKAIPETQPNLVIINAGSSDCFQEQGGWGSAHGYDYTKNLVDFVFEASPNATVILSTLVTSTNAAYERCIKSLNAQIRQVAIDVRRQGKHISLSEQHWDQGLPGRVTPKLIKSDQMHPTFDGWAMMGEIYKQDILDVDAQGWLVAPVENGIMADGDAERDLQDANAAKAKGDKEKVEDAKKTTANPVRRPRRNHI